MVAAIRVHKVGGPEVLSLDNVDLAAPKANELRIKQRACGINYSDTYFRTGVYKAPTMPFIVGNEGAGDVIAVGSAIREFKIDDRVAAIHSMGGYAAERLIPADRAIKLPDSITYEHAATMLLKGLTAQMLVRRVFRVEKYHTVLIHAAAGAIGGLVSQWANNLGATVIGTVGTEDKVQIAKENGCSHVILLKNFVAQAKEITNGKLCNVVYDGIGRATFPASLDCIRPRGLFVTYGGTSGPIDAFNIGLLSKNGGSLFATRPTLDTYIASRDDLINSANDLFKMLSGGGLKVPPIQKYSFKEVVKSHQDLEARASSGFSILIP